MCHPSISYKRKSTRGGGGGAVLLRVDYKESSPKTQMKTDSFNIFVITQPGHLACVTLRDGPVRSDQGSVVKASVGTREQLSLLNGLWENQSLVVREVSSGSRSRIRAINTLPEHPTTNPSVQSGYCVKEHCSITHRVFKSAFPKMPECQAELQGRRNYTNHIYNFYFMWCQSCINNSRI